MLNYSSVSSQLMSFYSGQKNKANPEISEPQKTYPPNPNPADEWVVEFQDVYDTDSIAGIMSQPSVLLLSMKDLLYFSVSNSTSTPTNMATAISEYWSAQLTPGAPILCGGTIVSITNDASKIKSPIESYMKGLSSSESSPYYEQLFSFIESQVKTIIWTVTELDGANCVVPTSYTVSVS